MDLRWTLDMDVEDVRLGGAITIKPKHGLHIRLERVDNSRLLL